MKFGKGMDVRLEVMSHNQKQRQIQGETETKKKPES